MHSNLVNIVVALCSTREDISIDVLITTQRLILMTVDEFELYTKQHLQYHMYHMRINDSLCYQD